MKVLFYDGNLLGKDFPSYAFDKAVSINYKGYECTINAAYGYSRCKEILDSIIEDQPDTVVLSNSLVALDNTYCWDEETNSCELYIYDKRKDEFVKAQDLTEREIKQGHNLEALYRNGAFDLEDGND